MFLIRFVVARMRALFRRNATIDEIQEELQFHLEMRANDFVRDGLDPAAARRAAKLRFGNVAIIQDRGYDVRGGGFPETIVQDVKYGLRQLRRQPSFTAIAVLTLALGTGVSTALFSVIDAALLRPLPYPNPEELVVVSVEEQSSGDRPRRLAPSIGDIRRWRTATDVIAEAGMGRVDGFVPKIVDAGTPQRLVVGSASEDFLETYGIVPTLGRGFDLADTREGSPAVVLLGHAFWQQSLGGDPGVLGRTVRVQDTTATIVGVLPSGFFKETAVWEPETFSETQLERRGSGTPVIARLRPGLSLARASDALGPLTPGARVLVQSMYEDETSGFMTTVRVLAMAVGLIMLIACVNVASLLLARGATRETEMAVRSSIGAGRGRLFRQLLTESLVLGAAGAALGIVLAHVSLNSLVALVPFSLPPNSAVEINTTVLAFAFVLTLLTSLIFGLVPAFRLSRRPAMFSGVLSIAGRSGAPLSKRAGQTMIANEVTLAIVLMAGAGLMLRSFAKLVAVDLGFDPTNVVMVDVEPIGQDAALRRSYYYSLVESVRQQPEIVAAGAVTEGAFTYGFATTDTGAPFESLQRNVVPGYFEALGVQPLAGRLLVDDDRATGEAVAINEAAAKKFFGGHAIGHSLRQNVMRGKTGRVWRIVGVVPDLRLSGPQGRVAPELFLLPDPADGNPSMRLALIAKLRPGASLSPDRWKEMAQSAGPRALVGEVNPLSDVVSRLVIRPKNRTLLLSLLGGFGFVLTLVGIFSTAAYSVARRTREIGVRVALGARPRQVIGAMMRDVATPVVAGLAGGLVSTYYATSVLKSFLFRTTPHDPATLAGVVVVLASAAALAAWLPARRAARVDPVSALRAE